MTKHQNNITPDNNDDFLQIKDLFYLCVSKWKWFVISLAITLGIAVIYLLKTPPVYTRTASVLIKEDSKGKSLSSEMEQFSNLGLFQSSTNVNNELITFKSPSYITEVVKRLQLDMNYLVPGTFHKKVAYGLNLPVTVLLKDIPENESASFMLQIQPDGTVILSELKQQGDIITRDQIKGKLNDTISTSIGRVIVNPTSNYEKDKIYTIYVTRSGLYSTIDAYTKKLNVSLNSKEASVINLSIKDKSIQRAEEVLNTLISVYNENWVKDKNQIAVSTSMFINERLKLIERELGNVDEDISSYKSENLLPDVQAASNMYMTQSSATNAQILTLNNQLYMTRYVRNYLANDANRTKLLPANSGIESGNIEAQITEYNKQLLQRNSLVANSSEQNPLVIDMDQSLSAMRSAIITSIDNLIVTLNTHIKSLQQAEQRTVSRIEANPTQAKYLLSVERQQKVKEALYLFLLQKREENELSQAFTAYNTKIITPPFGSMVPTSPIKRNILLIAFVIGLIIPIVIIFILESLNTTIRGRKDLENIDIPLVGEIPLYSTKQKSIIKVVKEGNRDIINEAFRVLRTNLEFMTENDNQSNVIVMTSFNPGSGKTFLSLNIATSLAIKNKKVLIIEGDMRHASLSQYINLPKKGISNYLNGNIDNINEIITFDETNQNLNFIPVGTIPPNPTELLFSPRLKQLIDSVRREYDYVFIDCPPVEIVADTQIIQKLADRTIFVVRAGLFERAMLAELEKYYDEKKYKNISLILNGTEGFSGKYRYGYKYGYHYGYGYGYNSDK